MNSTLAELPRKFLKVNGRTIAYRESGPIDGQPIVLVHGWPQTSWAWRHQLGGLALRGYRTIAPDLRGTGGSTVFHTTGDYSLRHQVDDMVALHDTLELDRATWVGHDWGAPIVWTTLRHHPDRFLAAGSISTPYDTLEHGVQRMASFVRREIYPANEYPAGQMDYCLFYGEHFAEAQAQFEADLPAFFANILTGDAPGRDQEIQPTATVRARGGWFDGGPAPSAPIDERVLEPVDLEQFVDDYRRTGFFGANALYMNDDDNHAFVVESGVTRLDLPTLFVTGRFDYVNDAAYSSLANPMRALATDLDYRTVDGSHWLAEELPDIVTDSIDDLARRGAESRSEPTS